MLRRSTLVRLQPVPRLPSAILASWVKATKPQRPRIGALLDMFLLQLIHDLAHGKYVDSPRDAKQLARFAAVCKEAYFLCATMNGIRGGRLEHRSLDGVWFRDFTRRTLDKFIPCSPHTKTASMIIEYFKPRIWAFQMMWNCDFEGWECIEAGRSCERRKRPREPGSRRAGSARRDEERQLREEMQSDEHFRKYRKQAEEGDAEAAAFFERGFARHRARRMSARARLSSRAHVAMYARGSRATSRRFSSTPHLVASCGKGGVWVLNLNLPQTKPPRKKQKSSPKKKSAPPRRYPSS